MRVSEHLVDVSLRRLDLLLQLEDADHAVIQNDHIATTLLARQFLLEDGRIFLRQIVRVDELAALCLQPGNRLIHRSHLLSPTIPHEVLQPQPHDARLSAVERGLVELAAAGRHRRSAQTLAP